MLCFLSLFSLFAFGNCLGTFWCVASVCLLGSPWCRAWESHVDLDFSWDGDGNIHFLVINFLSLGTSATTLMKRGSRLLLSISFGVSLTFWICMTSVSVVCWIVWHDLSSPFSLEVRICLRLVPCPLSNDITRFRVIQIE